MPQGVSRDLDREVVLPAHPDRHQFEKPAPRPGRGEPEVVNQNLRSSPDREPLELVLDLSRAASPADPFFFDGADQEYLRREEGKVWSAVFRWSKAGLAELSRPRPDPARVQRVGDVLREFLGGLGWEGDQCRIREAFAARRPVHLTCRFAATELY